MTASDETFDTAVEPASDLRQRIAEIVREHEGVWEDDAPYSDDLLLKCCGILFDGRGDHAAHVADAVLAVLQPDIDTVTEAISRQIPSMGWNEANRRTVIADAARAAVEVWTGERP